MATITEDYVSFETAKLLKKKGFDCPSYSHYRLDNEELCNFYTNCNTNLEQNNYITAPTLQMAMKWLREAHNLQIQIAPITSKHKDWTFGIYKEFSPLTIDLLCFPTYEQSCEAAIKYCLEHLI